MYIATIYHDDMPIMGNILFSGIFIMISGIFNLGYVSWWYMNIPDDMKITNNRRKFRSQTSDNMDRWKAEQGRGRREILEERRVEEKEYKKKEDADAWKGRKVTKLCFSQWFGAPEGRKVGSLKRRVRSQLARGEMKNCTQLFRSQNVQNTPWSDHFWKFRCRKSARRCGAKHISKSKC